jgi:hypothetical protein
MATTLFDKPLFVKRSAYIQELASLEEAFDFLEDWPEEKQCDAYHVLLKACRMAAEGIFPLTAIRENIRRFLLKERMLANIEEVPVFLTRRSERSIGS